MSEADEFLVLEAEESNESFDKEFEDRVFKYYVAIASYIALVRKDLKMDQVAFAEFCHLSTSTISALETPKKGKTCTLRTLLRVADALNASIIDILTYEPPKLKLENSMLHK